MEILAVLEKQLRKSESLFEVEQLILKAVLNLAQEIMKCFLENLDDKLMKDSSNDYQVINLQPRTINFCFGPVTFQRRYYKDQGFYLDNELKIKPRKRLSAYFTLMMAKIAQTTTMRNTANILNMFFDSGISVDSVMKAVHQLGPKVYQKTIANENQNKKRKVPQNLVIEGDAVSIKIKNHYESVHHYQIYEHYNGKKHNCRNFFSLGSHEKVETRVREYLDVHYRLNNQTIFLVSDAGPGYEPYRMLELVPIQTHGEYILDRYHCLRKIENTMGQQEFLTCKAINAVKNHDKEKLTLILDTYEAQDLTFKQREDLVRLRAYLNRNWDYILTTKKRGYSDVGNLGSIESSHRALTYRMKKQGKVWSKRGAEAMISLIEARVNHELDDSLESILKEVTALPKTANPNLETNSKIIRSLFKKVKSSSKGVFNGKVRVDAPVTSFIGKINKHYK